MYKQKDIYFARLNPVVGNEQGGVRPVVIISGDGLNEHTQLCIVCPLTTKIKNYPGSLFVKKNMDNNLSVDSEIRTSHIRSISKQRLLSKIGEISTMELREIFFLLGKVLRH